MDAAELFRNVKSPTDCAEQQFSTPPCGARAYWWCTACGKQTCARHMASHGLRKHPRSL